MKKITILLLIALLLFSSCTVSPVLQETTDTDKSENSEDTVPFETDPYVVTTEMFGEIYPVVEDTWHLSEWKNIPIKAFWFYEPIDFSPEAMKTYVKLPLEYEETVDGMTIKVEFFQETYPIFSYIQARISYTNNTGKSLEFNKNDRLTPGYFAADGELYCGCYESPGVDFVTDGDSTTPVPNGSTHTIEVIYLFTNRFDPNKTGHTYNIDAFFFVPDSGIPREIQRYFVSFPIEVLKSK